MKKSLCLLLTAVMIFAVLTALPLSFGAAQTDRASIGAPSQLPTYSDEPIVKAGRSFYFDAASANWTGFELVLYHLYEVGGGSVFPWGCKKAYAYDQGGGVWKVDFDAVALSAVSDSKQYELIFYNDKDDRTYPLLFDTSCFGDTAYCTGVCTQAPTDGGNTVQDAFWMHKDPLVYGPVLAIAPIGEVTGIACPKDKTRGMLLKDFLSDDLEYARKFSGKDDQSLIEGIIRALGLDVDEAAAIVGGYTGDIDWKPSEQRDVGDADGDGTVTSVDVTLIQRAVAQMDTGVGNAALMSGDVDGNGVLEIVDATYIQRWLAFMDVPYAIGEKNITVK